MFENLYTLKKRKSLYTLKKRKRILTAADKKRIAANQNWKCKICRHILPVRYHIDHIKEFSQRGSDRDSNLQALCPNCHAEKTETDRHKKRQRKIRDSENENSGGLFNSPTKRNKSQNTFGESSFRETLKKKNKKMKSNNNPFDFGL